MAPALTKIFKDGHSIHLSSPPASVRMDSNRGPMHSPELDCMRFTEDGDPQKIWLNLSSLPSLDSCLCVSPLDSPASPVCFPQHETVLLRSPSSFLSLLSFSNSHGDSHQVVSVLPGVSDMFLGLVPEHNSQEACLLHGCSDASESVPDGGDMHYSLPNHSSFSPSYSTGEAKSHGCTPYFAPPPTITEEKVAEMGSLPLASLQCFSGRLNFNQLASRAVSQQTLQEQLSRQVDLQDRAGRLQKRLQALLGEHSLLHCNQQLEGLSRHCQLGDVSHDSLDSIYPGILPPEAAGKHQLSWLGSSTASSSLTDLREFSLSSQAVLRSVQEALDSDATASSSSDEESVENNNCIKTSSA